MRKEINDILFTFTPDITDDLLVLLKDIKKLKELKNKYNNNKNPKLFININKLQEQVNISKKNFIKKFQKNNVKQIQQYWDIKKQNVNE